MPVTVYINRPHVVVMLSEKIHQRIVANLNVIERASGSRASVDEQHDLAGLRERSNPARQVFFPEVDSKPIAQDVVFFGANRLLGDRRGDFVRGEYHRDRQDNEQSWRPQAHFPRGWHVQTLPENRSDYGLQQD